MTSQYSLLTLQNRRIISPSATLWAYSLFLDVLEYIHCTKERAEIETYSESETETASKTETKKIEKQETKDCSTENDERKRSR